MSSSIYLCTREGGGVVTSLRGITSFKQSAERVNTAFVKPVSLGRLNFFVQARDFEYSVQAGEDTSNLAYESHYALADAAQLSLRLLRYWPMRTSL